MPKKEFLLRRNDDVFWTPAYEGRVRKGPDNECAADLYADVLLFARFVRISERVSKRCNKAFGPMLCPGRRWEALLTDRCPDCREASLDPA
jgi:hypothetical protein